MNKEEYDAHLKKEYGYSLLNFGYVIADVIAETNVYLSKKVRGRKKGEIEVAIARLEEIKQILRKEQDIFINDIELRPLFRTIDSILELLGEDLKQFRYEYDAMKNHLAMPQREGKPKPEKKGFQIFYLWAIAMKNEKGYVQWKKMFELLDWFYKYLGYTTYWNEKDMVDDKESAQTLFRRKWKKFRLILKILYSSYYFPPKNIEKGRPQIPQAVSNGGIRLFPVSSVKFYKNEIKTIFEQEDKQKVRTTYREKRRYMSAIRDYRQSEEESEKDKLLLEVP